MLMGRGLKTFIDLPQDLFFSLVGGVTTWASKKQTFFPLSYTKSEIMELSKVTT
jgi:hypothetical protein